MNSQDSEPLVRIAIAENAFTAGMLRDQLSEAGIPTLVRSDHSIILGPLAGGAFSFYIYVRASDARRAAAVIRDGSPMDPPRPMLSAPEREHRRKRRRWW